MKSVTTLALLLLCSVSYASEAYYHSVKAKSGDGIYSLLRRYHLIDEKCNKEQFLELNDLSLKDALQEGISYKLPLLIYKYDGQSIRTTIGVTDLDKALRIKAYNEQILSDNLRKTAYLDSKILWVPFHEVNCASAGIKAKPSVANVKTAPSKTTNTPSNKDVIDIKLFGADKSEVLIKDHSLKGKVYYVVSGHGGPDPGAMCTKACSNELCEDEYAYDVCLRLCRELISHGATAHMIIQDKNDGIREDLFLVCDKDETCMGKRIPLNQKARLNQRASAINVLYKKYKKQGVKDQIALMVHVDSNTKEKRQDVYFFHHKTSKKSKSLAKSLQTTFKAKYDFYQKNRGYQGFVRPRGLYMLNNTLPTAAYVELANIRNPNDQQRLIKKNNRELLAQWLFEGITEYQNVKIKRP